jgi:hypothetical protein
MAKLELKELSPRQYAVLADLGRVRLLSGQQLERLHFAQLATANARGSARRRSLGSLVTAGLVTTLPRRIGGERAGSAGLIYTLDAQGHRLLAATETGRAGQRVRRPWPIGWPFTKHSITVAEAYVRLRELENSGHIRLLHFATEPACWYRTAQGVLKPDAWVVYETGDWEEHWWLEVDLGTESMQTLDRKLRRYLSFATSGQVGPLGVTPRVLLTVPTAERLVIARLVVNRLPSPAEQLIEVREFFLVFGLPARPPP